MFFAISEYKIIYFLYSFLSFLFRFILEKCNGDLQIKNKKMKEIISDLVKRGYASDPVRVWKLKVDKEAALVSVNYTT